MENKCYYKEIATTAGRKCVVSFSTGRWNVRLIAYVGRVRVNYYMDIENMHGYKHLVPITAAWAGSVFPVPFSMLKASAGVRMYKGV